MPLSGFALWLFLPGGSRAFSFLIAEVANHILFAFANPSPINAEVSPVC